jgi:hypothetical protein
MAVALDMNRGHISDIEQGKREVGLITLQVIARGRGPRCQTCCAGFSSLLATSCYCRQFRGRSNAAESAKGVKQRNKAAGSCGLPNYPPESVPLSN